MRRSVPQAWDVGRHVLCQEGEVFRITVSEAKRLKALEDENAKLKRLLAEQMLDMAAMKEFLAKKWLGHHKIIPTPLSLVLSYSIKITASGHMTAMNYLFR